METFLSSLSNELFKLRRRKKYLVFLILGCAICVISALRVLLVNYLTDGSVDPAAVLGGLMSSNLTFILLIFLPLTPQLREEMGRAAVKAAQAVHYEGAGTVEFLLDSDGQHFYFMEMNTRIQVEHGITEMITGVDLVRQQLRIASGLPLDLTQEDVTLTGHAIECRINAEDPTANFRPCPGKVEFLHFPGGPGVRVDSALYNGCTLSPYYDSLAAKVMVHAPTRLEAIRRMRRCLEEFTLEGFPTNAELSYELLFHPTFVRGGCTTAFLDRSLPELLEFSRRVDDHKG